MAPILKVKLGIISISLFLLVMTHLYRYGFYQEGRINYWKTLSWSDFEGYPRPFSKFAAGISSDVHIEYDSAAGTYVAYAKQFTAHSWVDSGIGDANYILNHEQYHFNITEYHARLMNKHIQDHLYDSVSSYYDKLWEIRSALNSMQREYDHETNHSTIVDQQRLWEFKIDSLLSITRSNSGFATDSLSGASAFFPKEPDFQTGAANWVAYRIYYLNAYDMLLALHSYRMQEFHPSNFYDNIEMNIQRDSLEIVSMSLDTLQSRKVALVTCKDSSYQVLYLYKWIYEDDFLYKLTARLPSVNKQDGYYSIANSFINSFEVTTTEHFWTHKLDSIPPSEASPVVNTNRMSESSTCYNLFYHKAYSFVGKPFYSNSEVIIPLDPIVMPDGVISDCIASTESDFFINKYSSGIHVFRIPADKLPKPPYKLKLGYTSKDEGACYSYYYQPVFINY